MHVSLRYSVVCVTPRLRIGNRDTSILTHSTEWTLCIKYVHRIQNHSQARTERNGILALVVVRSQQPFENTNVFLTREDAEKVRLIHLDVALEFVPFQTQPANSSKRVHSYAARLKSCYPIFFLFLYVYLFVLVFIIDAPHCPASYFSSPAPPLPPLSPSFTTFR